MRNLINSAVYFSLVLVLTGCAAGAATAGYAIKAQSADGLTSEAEQKIVDRTKREIFAEISAGSPSVSCPR